MGGGGEVDTYVANLEKSLRESHELARAKLCTVFLHYDKLKICQARELFKWIHDYQARTCVIAEPAGDEPKKAQQEKNNERYKGSVVHVPKIGNQINAPLIGSRSRPRVVPETSQPL